MFHPIRTIFVALAMVLSVAVGAPADAEARRDHVDFAGWSGAAIDGVIEGRDYVQYELSGVAGDTLTVRLSSPNQSAYFNVYEPGRGPGEEALANSSLISALVPDLNVFTGTLPETGVYSVVVYLFRAAARDGEIAPYSIEFDLVAPTAASDPDGAPAVFQVRTRMAGGHLNVHTAPSVDAPRIGRYNNGAILQDIGGCSEAGGREWCEVMSMDGGLAGYVAREFLAPVQRHAGAPVSAPRPVSPLPVAPPSPTARLRVTPSSDFFHVHLGNPRGHLNVHADPTTRSVRVGRLPDGADLQNIGGCVESEGRFWCDVMQAGGGVSGWVAADYLRDGHPPAAHVTLPSGAPAAVTADFADGLAGGPDYWRVNLNRRGSALRVHTQPSTSAPVFARFHDGATLRNAGGCRIVNGQRWCYVRSISGDVVGWVAGDYLNEGSEPGIATHLPSPPPQIPVAPVEPQAEPAYSGPDYDMTGTIACVRDRDAASAMCSYGTIHEGSGSGFLTVTEEGFGNRTVTFENGVPVYFDQSQADGDIEMRVSRDGDMWTVFIGEMRLEIPAALFAPHMDIGTATQLPLVPPPMSNEGDALVEGTPFNATTQITCNRDRDAADASCEAGVIRDGNGNGSITVFWPDGGSRVLFYEDNTPVYYDQSEADGGAEMTVTSDGDDYTVFVGDARFVIPSALMTGG